MQAQPPLQLVRKEHVGQLAVLVKAAVPVGEEGLRGRWEAGQGGIGHVGRARWCKLWVMTIQHEVQRGVLMQQTTALSLSRSLTPPHSHPHPHPHPHPPHQHSTHSTRTLGSVMVFARCVTEDTVTTCAFDATSCMSEVNRVGGQSWCDSRCANPQELGRAARVARKHAHVPRVAHAACLKVPVCLLNELFALVSSRVTLLQSKVSSLKAISRNRLKPAPTFFSSSRVSV